MRFKRQIHLQKMSLSIFYQSKTVKYLHILLALAILVMLGFSFPRQGWTIIEDEATLTSIADFKNQILIKKPYDLFQEHYEDRMEADQLNKYIEDNSIVDGKLSIEELREVMAKLAEDAIVKLKHAIDRGDPQALLREYIYYTQIDIQLFKYKVISLHKEESVLSDIYDPEAYAMVKLEAQIPSMEAYLSEKPVLSGLIHWLANQQLVAPILSFWGISILFIASFTVTAQYRFLKAHKSLLLHRPLRQGINKYINYVYNGLKIFSRILRVYFIGLVAGLAYLSFQHQEPPVKVLKDILAYTDLQALAILAVYLLIAICFVLSLARLLLNLTRSIVVTIITILVAYFLPYIQVIITGGLTFFHRFNPFLYLDVEKILYSFRNRVFYAIEDIDLFAMPIAMLYLFLLIIVMEGINYTWVRIKRNHIYL